MLFLAVTACAGLGWQAAELRDHPLVGHIWDARAGRFVEEAEVFARLPGARFVLLGETHDNPDHHRLQERVLNEVLKAGGRPALVMEQFDTTEQSAMDEALRAPGRSADGIAGAGKLNRRGWDWPLYEPLVALALEYDLPVVAANLSRQESRQVVAAGFDALGPVRQAVLGLEAVWSEARQARVAQAISGGHCGHAPGDMLPGLVRSQRARDAVMASAIAAQRERGAVAIIGRGHSRADVGVPIYLANQAPGVPVLNIAFAEVDEDTLDPRRYAAYSDASEEAPLYDYVWFTPREARPDPCAGLSAEKLRGRPPAKPTEPKAGAGES